MFYTSVQQRHTTTPNPATTTVPTRLFVIGGISSHHGVCARRNTLIILVHFIETVVTVTSTVATKHHHHHHSVKMFATTTTNITTNGMIRPGRTSRSLTLILTTLVLLVVSTSSLLCNAFPIVVTQQPPRYTLATTSTTSSSSTSSSRLYAVEKGSTGNFLDNLFSSLTSAVTMKEVIPIPSKPKYENVIIEPDFRIAGLFLSVGLLLDTVPYLQLTLGPFITLLGILFVVQTFRIRFVFTEENQFELKTVSLSNTSNSNDDVENVAALRDSGENVIVGGANCWDCDTIVNYDFFPRSMMDLPFLEQPVLIYFKETQTPASTWNEGPGKMANDPDKVANGSAIPGQVHFFPAICNAKQIEREFQKRNVQKL